MTEQLSIEKKSLILEAACKRFAYYGFSKVTMDEIASDVGLGKASLYYYFPTKESLFEKVLRNEFVQFFTSMEKILNQEIPASKIFRLYASERLEYFKKLVNLRALSVQGSAESRTVDFEMFKEFQRAEIDMIQKILLIGKKRGEFYIPNPGRTAEMILQMLFGARVWNLKMRQNVFNDEAFEAMKVSMKEIIEIIINGILKK
jgi:TetR/AcrR family transcriptional repressor of mexJK operon